MLLLNEHQITFIRLWGLSTEVSLQVLKRTQNTTKYYLYKQRRADYLRNNSFKEYSIKWTRA